jgi:hypothetical protein
VVAPIGRPGALAPAVPTSAFSNFLGTGDTSAIPADATMAAGPNNIVLAVNTRVEVYSKVGVRLASTDLPALFASVTGDGIFDPWVVYDPYLQRFWLSAVSKSDNPHRSTILLALSNQSDATAGWSVFSVDATLNGSTPSGFWCDFPKLGFDTQAIYLTCNMYTFAADPQFQYARIKVLSKGQFVNGGGTVSWWDFWNLEEGGEIAVSIEPARMRHATDGDGEFLINAHGQGGSDHQLEIWHITNPQTCCGSDAHAPDLAQNGRPVGSFDPPPAGRQKGTGATIDTGHGRGSTDLLYAVWQGGHIFSGGNMACPHQRAACVSYTEVDVSRFPTMSVVSDFAIETDGSTDRFFPSADVNAAGEKTMLFGISGPNRFVGSSIVRIPPSTTCTNCFFDVRSIADGFGPYGQSGRQRWGDYHGAGADPDNDGVWVFGEFVTSDGHWGTEVALTLDRTPTAVTYTGPTGAGSHQTVNLTANLVQYAPGAPVPRAGVDITFFVGTQVCTATTDQSGQAVCPLALDQPDGTVALEAEYPGDPTTLPSSTTVDFVIGATGRQAATLTYLGPTSGDFEDEVALAASLTGAAGGPVAFAPIAFTLGSQSCRAFTDPTGVASCPIRLLQKPGSYTVVASFAGDGEFLPARVSVPFTINREEVTVTLTSPKNPSDFGQDVVFNSHVTGDDPGFQPPTGRVTFRRGTIVLGSKDLDASNNASWTAPLLQVGDNHITASYEGNDFFLPGTGDVTQQVICSKTFTGAINGGLNLTAGSTCLDHASVRGQVVIGAGAAVSVNASILDGGVFASGGLALTLCGTTLKGSTFVQLTTKYVLVGYAGDDDRPDCAANTVEGSTTFFANQGQIEIGGNQIKGSLVVSDTSGTGPDQESQRPEIEGNNITGSLFCNGNSPPPTNDNKPNTSTGQSFGQCLGL